MRRYGTFTPARRAALHRAAIISAAKRHGRPKSPQISMSGHQGQSAPVSNPVKTNGHNGRRIAKRVAVGSAIAVGGGLVAYGAYRSQHKTLYHATSDKNAQAILHGGFKGRQDSAWHVGPMRKGIGHAYFSNRKNGMSSKGTFGGKTVLKVKVKRSKVHKDWHKPPRGYREKWSTVHEKDLHGIKVKQVKTKSGYSRRQQRLVDRHMRRKFEEE